MRQKSFVLGAATLGALAATGADAQIYTSATYSVTPGSAMVTGNAGQSTGAFISDGQVLSATVTGTSAPVTVTGLPLFNPANYHSGNPNFTVPDLLGVTLSLSSAISFAQQVVAAANYIGIMSVSMYANPFSGSLVLTQPSLPTITQTVAPGTPNTSTILFAFIFAQTASTTLSYSTAASDGSSGITGPGVSAFIGTGNVQNLSLKTMDDSMVAMSAIGIGDLSYSLAAFYAQNASTTVSITYNLAYLHSAPAPGALAVFAPGAGMSLLALRRRRRAA